MLTLPVVSNHRPQTGRIAIEVKTTNACNLGCSYCYIDPRAAKGVMKDSTLESLISKSLSTHESVHYMWHGGEPLLVGLSFFRKAVALQQRFPGKVIVNNIQTSGTLITDEVLDFCEEHGFGLGFSLDGPVELNDRTRLFHTGKSTFQTVIESLRKAMQRGLGNAAIVVVNRYNLAELSKVYAFAKSEGINLKFHPLLKAGAAITKYLNLGIEAEEYGRALIELFDEWFYDETEIILEPLWEIIGNLLSEQPVGCYFNGSCQSSYVAVDPQGNVYPCGLFDGMAEFNLGNINEQDFIAILESERRREIRGRESRIADCNRCQYQKVCNSGCMFNAYTRSGTIEEKDYFCESYQMWYRHLGEVIERELRGAEIADSSSPQQGADEEQGFIFRGRKVDPARISNRKLARIFRKRVYLPQILETARVLYKSAEAHRLLGRWEMAERLYRRAARIQRNVLGAQHPDCLLSLKGLAKLQEEQGLSREVSA
jgi:serine-type anaerobic sulfatase-maturating enzyme